MKNFGYITPKTLEEASGLLKNPRTAAMGGGTDLLGVIKDGLLPSPPKTVGTLIPLPALGGLAELPVGRHGGACVTGAERWG